MEKMKWRKGSGEKGRIMTLRLCDLLSFLSFELMTNELMLDCFGGRHQFRSIVMNLSVHVDQDRLFGSKACSSVSLWPNIHFTCHTSS